MATSSAWVGPDRATIRTPFGPLEAFCPAQAAASPEASIPAEGFPAESGTPAAEALPPSVFSFSSSLRITSDIVISVSGSIPFATSTMICPSGIQDRAAAAVDRT